MQRVLFDMTFRAIVTGSGGLLERHVLCRTSQRLTGTQLRKHCQFASNTGQFSSYRLTHRTLINVSGQDTSSFLQGIITNDIAIVGDAVCSMYAHMLNVQGRTLYDIIIYSLKENPKGFNGVLLECDITVQDSIIRLLNVYKIRRKVKISLCPDLSLWTLLPRNEDVLLGKSMPNVTEADEVLVLEQDPRTELMGWRMITSHQYTPHEIVYACRHGNPEEYHTHRYKIGLPEGVKDLPPGEALPLESNLLYMNGISFVKGCYIGQELTARTHHTGVIRKRLMPVTMSATAESLGQAAALETKEGKPAGKHRAGVGKLGLSLVRLAYAKEQLKLKSSDGTTVTVHASVPDWWPKKDI